MKALQYTWRMAKAAMFGENTAKALVTKLLPTTNRVEMEATSVVYEEFTSTFEVETSVPVISTSAGAFGAGSGMRWSKLWNEVEHVWKQLFFHC